MPLFEMYWGLCWQACWPTTLDQPTFLLLVAYSQQCQRL